jgi:Flp pilus assembly pilin Flp
MKLLLKRFLMEESGTTLVEYAVISAIISASLIATFVRIGTQVNGLITPVSNGLN